MNHPSIARPYAQDPEEKRYRQIRAENSAFQAHVATVKGASLVMEAMGWEDSADGSQRVMPEPRAAAAAALAEAEETLRECFEALVAKATVAELLREAPEATGSASRVPV